MSGYIELIAFCAFPSLLEPLSMRLPSTYRRRTPQKKLPVEVLENILRWLSARELARTLSVSKHWFGLLTHTPSLWRRLYLLYYRDGRRHALCLPLMELMISYSTGQLLELTLVGLPATQYVAAAAIIRQTMHRIRVLEVWFDSGLDTTMVHAHYQHFLRLLCDIPAPVLTRLSLGYYGDTPDKEFAVPAGIFAGQAPSLNLLVLATGLRLDETQVTPAFRRVRAFTYGSAVWDISTALYFLPRLEALHLYAPSSAPIPDANRLPTPSQWGGKRALCLSVPQMLERVQRGWLHHEGKILEIAGSAIRGGVQHIVLRPGDALLECLEGARTLLFAATTLSITSGGPDRGLDASQGQFTGLNVLFADNAKRSVSVECGVPKAMSPISAQVGILWTVLHRTAVIFRTLTKLILSESMLAMVHSQFGTMHLPSLTTLVICVSPSWKRRSQNFGTLNDLDPRVPLLVAEKLTTLCLMSSPILPEYASGGQFLHIEQGRRGFDEPYEVSAVSVAYFIKENRDVLRLGPLSEIVLDKNITFSEGFYKARKDILLPVTRNVGYELY